MQAVGEGHDTALSAAARAAAGTAVGSIDQLEAEASAAPAADNDRIKRHMSDRMIAVAAGGTVPNLLGAPGPPAGRA